MKPGVLISSFTDNKNRTVTVTTITEGDCADLLSYANALIAEDTFVLLSGDPLTKEHEETYVKDTLKLQSEDKKIHCIARCEGKLISSFEVRRYSLRKSHVGEVGISVTKEFRDSGIGKKCMQILIEEAKKIGLRMLVLTCFAMNFRAIGLYTSCGFKQTGVVPGMLFFKGTYVDEVSMCLSLV